MKNELNLLVQFCEDYVKNLAPDILINLAAYTAVDKAENDIYIERLMSSIKIIF